MLPECFILTRLASGPEQSVTPAFEDEKPGPKCNTFLETIELSYVENKM